MNPGVQNIHGAEGLNADNFAKELAKKEKDLVESQKYCNYLQDQVEDFMAENKYLRSLGGVPDNFGKVRE
jgi:hypothetical protein